MHVSHCLSSPWLRFNSRPRWNILRDFSLADHTLAARPEPAWPKMAQSPLNGTTQPRSKCYHKQKCLKKGEKDFNDPFNLFTLVTGYDYCFGIVSLK